MLDVFIFAVLPYLALAILFTVTPYRYFTNRLKWSAFSTAFWGRKNLYFGSMGWHYGTIILLLGHLIGLLFPGPIRALLSNYSLLVVLESLALSLGLFAILGSVILILRRTSKMVRVVTGYADWLLLFLLLFQAVTGVYMGLFVRWGMQWYLDTAVPWLYSVFTLSPDITYVATLPLVFKLHVLGAFLILIVLPFTKLVHLLFLPLGFLTQPPILYKWSSRRPTS